MLASRLPVRRIAFAQVRKMSTVFDSKNKIPEIRAKYYSNPTAGQYQDLIFNLLCKLSKHFIEVFASC